MVGIESLRVRLQTQAAADIDPFARRFLLRTWPGLQHLYTDNASLLEASSSFCCRCEGTCQGVLQTPDIVSGGFPCKPWTLLRQNSGGTARTGAPHEHPCFRALTEHWPAYLREKQPAGCFVEEVETLLRLDPQTGQPYLNAIVAAISQEGYSVSVVKLDLATWINVPRVRLFLLGFRASCGGGVAADWATQRVDSITSARAEKGAGICVWQVTYSAADEAERIHNAKVHQRRFHFQHSARVCPSLPVLFLCLFLFPFGHYAWRPAIGRRSFRDHSGKVVF